MKIYPNNTTYNKRKIIHVSLLFLVLHIASKIFLGSGNFELTWDTWRNPKNVYDNFNDSNKCLVLTGLYEYTFRDFYVTYIKPSETKTDTESKFLTDLFSESNTTHKNKYTGKFKNKNVIFLL